MVRVLFEISLPAPAIGRLQAVLEPGILGRGVTGRLELVDRSGGCESAAKGGEAQWTPCWISLEAADAASPAFAASLRVLRETVVEVAREAGLEIYALPASAQIGDEGVRLRDVLDILGRTP